MSRDRAVPVLLGLLFLLALPSTGLVDVGAGLSTPAAFLAVAVLVTGFFAFVVGPALEAAGPGRPLALLVAALPFLVYGALETPALAGTRSVPAPGFWMLVSVGLVLPAAGRRQGGVVVAVVLTVLAGGSLLGALPRALDLPAAPTAWAGGSPDGILEERAEVPELVGVKRGAPVVAGSTPPLGSGAGPFLVEATRGLHPVDAPLYMVFGINGELEGRTEGPGTFLPGSARTDLVSALELDPYDAAIVLPGAWSAREAGSSRIAAALATYVRRGGVLVGPAPGRSWPAPLGQELGTAGRGWTTGLAGAQPFGLGIVVRADSETGIRQVLEAAAGRIPVGTVFDDPDAAAPPLPRGLTPWSDRPHNRRPQGLLLVVYGVVAVLLDLVLRGAVPRVMGLVAPAVAVALGLVWTSPADPGVQTHAMAFELGGGGGRRLEAVALSACPAGWVGPCRYRGRGLLRLVGAHPGPDGLVRIRPGRTAWALRETVARGQASSEPEARSAGFLRELLRGDVEATRLRLGRGGALAVHIGDGQPPVTWIARWR